MGLLAFSSDVKTEKLMIKVAKKNNFFNLYKEIKACPVEHYDLVINDFEPISAWACKIKGIDCISLSHQSALLSSKVPRPLHHDFLGSLILKQVFREWV